MIDLSDIPPIDWAAVRHRIRAAGIFLGETEFAEKVAGMTDDQLNDEADLIVFGIYNAISIDWLVTGEGLPMLDPERTRRHPVDGQAPPA